MDTHKDETGKTLSELERIKAFKATVENLHRNLDLPDWVKPVWTMPEGETPWPTHQPVCLLVECYCTAKQSLTNGKPEKGRWNPRTYAVHSSYLKRWATWMDKEDRPITNDTIREYWSTLDTKEVPSSHYGEKHGAGTNDRYQRSNTTKRNHQREIKNCCTWLYKHHLIPVNPFVGEDRVTIIPDTREERLGWSDEDIAKMFAWEAEPVWKRLAKPEDVSSVEPASPVPACQNTGRAKRKQWTPGGPMEREALQAQCVLALGVDSAGRASELCRVDCGHVREEWIVVLTKGEHTGVLFTSKATRALLLQLAEGRADNEPLFIDWHGKRCTPRSLLRLIQRLAERAHVALPADPLHSLRHYAAEYWASKGLPDLVIQRFMNHANLSTTQLYAKPPRGKAARLHEENSPIAGFLSSSDQTPQEREEQLFLEMAKELVRGKAGQLIREHIRSISEREKE